MKITSTKAKDFNKLRSMYLKELAALRAKYAPLFIMLVLGRNTNEHIVTTENS